MATVGGRIQVLDQCSVDEQTLPSWIVRVLLFDMVMFMIMFYRLSTDFLRYYEFIAGLSHLLCGNLTQMVMKGMQIKQRYVGQRQRQVHSSKYSQSCSPYQTEIIIIHSSIHSNAHHHHNHQAWLLPTPKV